MRYIEIKFLKLLYSHINELKKKIIQVCHWVQKNTAYISDKNLTI